MILEQMKFSSWIFGRLIETVSTYIEDQKYKKFKKLMILIMIKERNGKN